MNSLDGVARELMFKIFRYIDYIVLIFLGITMFGILSISYSSTLDLLLGLLMGGLLFILIVFISKIIKYVLRLVPKWLLIYNLIFIPFFISLFIFFYSNLYFSGGSLSGAAGVDEPDECGPYYPDGSVTKITVTDYYTIVEPVDFSLGIFKVSEEARYKIENIACNFYDGISKTVIGEEVIIAERLVNSSKRGLIVRELLIVPLEGTPLEENCCPSNGSVELRDFPKNSFYEARNIQSFTTSSYLDTETTQWRQYLGNNNIVFAYLASPFYFFRTLLSPLIGVSYESNWVISFAGILVSFVIIPIAKPIFTDFLENKIKVVVAKRQFAKVETKKSLLIISSKGEEKEIEIKKQK